MDSVPSKHGKSGAAESAAPEGSERKEIEQRNQSTEPTKDVEEHACHKDVEEHACHSKDRRNPRQQSR